MAAPTILNTDHMRRALSTCLSTMRSLPSCGSRLHAVTCWRTEAKRTTLNNSSAWPICTWWRKTRAIICLLIFLFLKIAQTNDAMARKHSAGSGRAQRGQGEGVPDHAGRDDWQRCDCTGNYYGFDRKSVRGGAD